jgi:DNA-directed RNA polymerase subunit RPC12/RpoP
MMAFFSLFGFIGVAFLIFLWSQSFHEFGAPPLIFRVVGSFIALAFIAMGFGLPITAWRARAAWREGAAGSAAPVSNAPASQATATVGYKCPHCGAGLGPKEDVSPSGDVKCGYCNKWWNIHAP